MKSPFLVTLFLILFYSCKKDDTIHPTPTNYDFNDLAVGENLLDSIKLKGTFQYTYKFIYQNKYTINYINRQDPWSFTWKDIVDTLGYSNNTLVNYNSHSDAVPQLIKILNQGTLPSRFYYYDDNYTVSTLRQLGAYLEYSSTKPSKVSFKFINTSAQRDSIVLNIKRNSNGDIDSIFEQNNSNPTSLGNFKLKFEYNSIQNKLNNNANLKALSYFFIPVTLGSFSPIIFDFGNIDTYPGSTLDYPLFNTIFCDVLFNSTVLPSSFTYKKNNSLIPFYMKYTYNADNYISSFSIGSSTGFNQVTNQRAIFTYNKRP